MAAKISKEQYFFGFGKFLNFSNDQKLSGAAEGDLANKNVGGKINYVSPIRIHCAASFEKTYLGWCNIFHLCKDSGQVHAYGWCNGREIKANENAFLPMENKIVNLQVSAGTMILISENGKCYVIPNVKNDWAARAYEKELKFLSCGVGETHAIVVDGNGSVEEIKGDRDIKECSSDSLFTSVHLKVMVDAVSCGKEHVLLLNKKSGQVFSFGLGSRGQLGHGEVNAETVPKRIEALAGISIQQVAAGGWHSMALSDIGDIYVWGWNNCGQLGITCLPPEVAQAFYMLPYVVEFPYESSVGHIACGARHSGAVMVEPRQSVWTWGWGKYGQLGHGDSLDRSTPTIVGYFENMDAEILDITCGPWQTVVTLARKFC